MRLDLPSTLRLGLLTIGLRFPPTQIGPERIANFRWRFVPVIAAGMSKDTAELRIDLDLRDITNRSLARLYVNVLRWEELARAIESKAIKRLTVIVRLNSVTRFEERVGDEERLLLEGRLRAEGLDGAFTCWL